MASLRDAFGALHFIWAHPANQSHKVRALATAVRFQLRGRILGKRTVATIGERSRMWAELHWNAASKVAYANPPDWEPMHAWRAALSPGDLFIDVGANIGAYSVWAAEIGAEVIAIEPDADARTRLEANIALNGYSVAVVGAALADRTGSMRFTNGLGTLNRLVTSKSCEPERAARKVRVDTLDNVIGDRCAAGVKIDVEGAERLVLEGARMALADHRIRLLQLEWNSASLELLDEDRGPLADLLASYGYSLFRATGDGQLVPLGEQPTFGADVFARPAD
jgi:FkbM family methyltransferase